MLKRFVSLNLYRVLYLNNEIESNPLPSQSIEPIQSVVFKLSFVLTMRLSSLIEPIQSVVFKYPPPFSILSITLD